MPRSPAVCGPLHHQHLRVGNSTGDSTVREQTSAETQVSLQQHGAAGRHHEAHKVGQHMWLSSLHAALKACCLQGCLQGLHTVISCSKETVRQIPLHRKAVISPRPGSHSIMGCLLQRAVTASCRHQLTVCRHQLTTANETIQVGPTSPNINI